MQRDAQRENQREKSTRTLLATNDTMIDYFVRFELVHSYFGSEIPVEKSKEFARFPSILPSGPVDHPNIRGDREISYTDRFRK